MFDPTTFLQTTLQGANSTEYVNIPEGEYIGMIRPNGIQAREITTDQGKSIVLDLTWETDDQRASEVTGMKAPTARQSIFLDLSPEGNIDLSKGKNVKLGRLREALRQNDPARSWSFSMLAGVPARFSVKHRTADDGKVYADVKEVTAL